VTTSMSRRLLKPLALVIGGILLSGCSGEENIPLKKVDFVLDAPPKDYKEKRKAFVRGSSANMGRDPFGVSSEPPSKP
jgi:hypothetical protein